MLKTDAGPGRFGKRNEVALDQLHQDRARWFRHLRRTGLMMMLGIPNATEANAEPDQLFGAFKSGLEKVQNRILARKRAANKAARQQVKDGDVSATKDIVPVVLKKEDVWELLDGRHDDPPEMQPFSFHLQDAKKLEHAAARVGACPATRAPLFSGRLRPTMASTATSKKLKDLYTSNKYAVAACRAAGMNMDALEAEEPKFVGKDTVVAQNPERAAIWERVQALTRLSGGTAWHAIGAKCINCDEALEAWEEKAHTEKQKNKAKEDKAEAAALKRKTDAVAVAKLGIPDGTLSKR
jgi:hypothetical protein